MFIVKLATLDLEYLTESEEEGADIEMVCDEDFEEEDEDSVDDYDEDIEEVW